ncbi:MAG TPA: prolyl oligopeptidase family serine peptidase [Stellaceae bacterium]|jgi:dipeptidyl aminopeptidase/acylaminoacyl peptidase|nr:prolyl oligopeptidase family serine peptidase [Stellaceae bacterium]
MPETLPYGAWRSPITSDLIVAGSIGLGGVMVDGGDIYWTESRPTEGGRGVVVRRGGDGADHDVTPPPWNARTRVHEYGGGGAAVDRGTVYFSHFADQRLYRLAAGGTPEPLTPATEPGTSLRYADGVIDRARGRWVGVREQHLADGTVTNTIVAVGFASLHPGRVLAQGADFYAAPRLSPDGKNLAFLQWNHPNMPWVGTELRAADVAEDGSLGSPRLVAGGERESVAQPRWSPDGILHFISDRSGWWNLYRWDGAARALCPRETEFCGAQWVFGQASYAFLGPATIVCAYGEDTGSALARLDIATGKLTPLSLPYTEFGSIHVAAGRIVCGAGRVNGPGAIVAIDPETGACETLKESSTVAADPDLQRCFSVARHIEFPTGDGETAHANFYPPANPDFAAPAGEAPPLVVKCHGGPTSSASSTLSLGIQYWTSRGIAVVDVDYRGSTGYGRAYRDRLEGAWGVADVEDCVAAARHAAAAGLADPERAVITGGSAGGYTVLAALAGSDTFRGGASYYGVSDVAALARDTHKFESRYLDWLIGPYPAEEALYRERSPLTRADKITRPVIFFQGADDKIVPPNQTEMMVDALRRRGIPTGYLLFAGEGHGFRRAENVKRALDAELYFYAELVFRTRLSF